MAHEPKLQARHAQIEEPELISWQATTHKFLFLEWTVHAQCAGVGLLGRKRHGQLLLTARYHHRERLSSPSRNPAVAKLTCPLRELGVCVRTFTAVGEGRLR